MKKAGTMPKALKQMKNKTTGKAYDLNGVRILVKDGIIKGYVEPAKKR